MVRWFKARTVVESQQYQTQRDLIAPDIRRFDEVMRGVYWAFSTRPEAFPSIEGSEIYVLKTDEWPDAPRVRIFYRFDESNVYLSWIESI